MAKQKITVHRVQMTPVVENICIILEISITATFSITPPDILV